MDRVQAVVEELRRKGGESFYVQACRPTMSLIRWVTSGLNTEPGPASWSRYFFSAGVSTSIASREAA